MNNLETHQTKSSYIRTNKITFKAKSQDPFSLELSEAKQNYFNTHQLRSTGTTLTWFKGICYILTFFSLIATLYLVPLPTYIALTLCVLTGFCASGIGFNIGHDALHGAFSSNKTISKLAGHTFTLIGANTHNWIVLHNQIHHNYTNIIDADGDLEPIPLLRFFQKEDGLKPYHRFQHIYAPFLYAFTSLVWVFKKDFDHIHKTSHMGHKKPALPRGEFKKLIVFKSLYLFAFLVAPMIWSPYSVGGVILGFLFAHFAQGLSLALVFQLGHLVEGPRTSEIASDGTLDAWYKIQLEGTCNFCTDSKIAAWLLGGLNQQIEHHLFPQVNHVHYPALSKIVKELAIKHQLPYHEHKTYWSALLSHFKTLRLCGKKQNMYPQALQT